MFCLTTLLNHNNQCSRIFQKKPNQCAFLRQAPLADRQTNIQSDMQPTFQPHRLLNRPRRTHTMSLALCEPRRYWSAEEHDRFIEAVCLWGCKAVKQISEAVGTRNVTQVRTHMQKWKQRLDAMFIDQVLPSIIEFDVPLSQPYSTSGSNENVAPGGEEESVSMFHCNESASFLGSESEADELLSLFSFSTPSSPVKEWPLSISLLEAYGEYSG